MDFHFWVGCPISLVQLCSPLRCMFGTSLQARYGLYVVKTLLKRPEVPWTKEQPQWGQFSLQLAKDYEQPDLALLLWFQHYFTVLALPGMITTSSARRSSHEVDANVMARAIPAVAARLSCSG